MNSIEKELVSEVVYWLGFHLEDWLCACEDGEKCAGCQAQEAIKAVEPLLD
jgi:hypothetical protein